MEMNRDNNPQSAGAEVLETSACKSFGDEIVEIVSLVRGAVANLVQIGAQGVRPDMNAIAPAFFEMCLTRSVDAALTYVSRAVHLVYRAHPKAANASETIDIALVLQYATIDELIDALIERRVLQLSYRSLADVDEHLSKTLRFSLFARDDQR